MLARLFKFLIKKFSREFFSSKNEKRRNERKGILLNFRLSMEISTRLDRKQLKRERNSRTKMEEERSNEVIIRFEELTRSNDELYSHEVQFLADRWLLNVL